MTHPAKLTPRKEYQLQENQRAAASPSLAARFPRLQSLTVELSFMDSEGLIRSSQIKYTVNLEHAKSVFRFACHNPECVAGDFDLSQVLAQAIQEGRTHADGELRCHGWQSRTTIGSVKCQNLLRYKLALGY